MLLNTLHYELKKFQKKVSKVDTLFELKHVQKQCNFSIIAQISSGLWILNWNMSDNTFSNTLGLKITLKIARDGKIVADINDFGSISIYPEVLRTYKLAELEDKLISEIKMLISKIHF